MSDLLQAGSEWLEGQRTSFMSRSVTYMRAGLELDLLATIGKTVFRVDLPYGLHERTEARDYLVLAADLILDNEVVLPMAGDRIQEVQGDRVYIYGVMAPGEEPPWRYSDPYRQTLRIHTKLVSTEGIPAEPEFALSMTGSIAVETELEV